MTAASGEVTLPANYPSHRAVNVDLRDGSTVHVRPVLPGDDAGVLALFGRLSSTSLVLRFHGSHRLTAAEARYFTTVDYRATHGLVAEHMVAGAPRIVAMASYFATRDRVAECAFVVDDTFQGRGLGSVMVEHLAEAAAEAGLETLEAEVLASNSAMLEVFAATRLPLHRRVSAGEVHVEFPTSPSREALEAFDRREANASAAAVRACLQPGSVAVVGASRTRGTVGGEIFHNLMANGFTGPVYPVNPQASVVQSVPAYPSLLAVPGPVDLAVIVVPSPAVAGVMQQCGDKGVRAAIIISAGFAETGAAGRALEAEVVHIAREFGIRIIGPNCLGVMNLNPAIRLNASFAPEVPPLGRLSFSSQSGALGIALIQQITKAGLGMSSFASIGNKADISGNDLLQYWEQDPDTDVILMYLESVADPRAFARIARRVSKSKPVIAVKSGRSAAGARAAASHTASLAAGEVAIEALFHQTGVIRTDTVQELFQCARLLVRQPLPAGNRVAILTNAGGLGILCTDACEAGGLVVPEISEQTRAALGGFLPAAASLGNPVDMLATATAGQYARALAILAADPGVDAIIVAFIPPLVTQAEDVAAAIVAAAPTIPKTLLACFAGVEGMQEHLGGVGSGVPAYAFPESAARALVRVSRYAAWRKRDEGAAPTFGDVQRGRAAALAAKILQRRPGWLRSQDVADLLACYGIPLVRGRSAQTPEDVAAAATEIAAPVVVKIDALGILHKSDVGAVVLNLASPQEAAQAARDILARIRAAGHADPRGGFLVQEMVGGPGAELFVGVVSDPLFGPLVACGAGGTLVELIKDISVRVTPLTDVDAAEMLRELKTFPLLEGYRGSAALDVASVEDLLLRVSLLVEDLAPVAELDLNPVFVGPQGHGCRVLDARIRLAATTPPRPRGARRS